MSLCHECGAVYLEGALYCIECGAYVFHDADSDMTLKVAASGVADSEVSTRPLDYRLGFGIKADRIVFVVPSSGRRLEVELGQTISVGRVDTRQGIWPEVDLTLDEGAEKGVSRKHALVRSSDEGVVLVDLGSTNGTRVNDRRMPPERPHLLKNGDAVRFGNLLVRIYFES